MYHNTYLEDFIEALYTKIGVFHPSELDMFTISKKLNIKLYVTEHDSLYFNTIPPVININNQQSKEKQWEDFGHETCHLQWHVGNQLCLPVPYIKWMERKANNFALNFCVPTFMLMKMVLPSNRDEAINIVSETFNVTTWFANARLIRYENNLLGQAIAERGLSYQ